MTVRARPAEQSAAAALLRPSGPAAAQPSAGTATGVVVRLLAACGVGTDAVVAGSTFAFVAPGGQTRILYDPPDTRGSVSGPACS